MTGLQSIQHAHAVSDAIRDMIPDPAPSLSESDICYLTGLKPRELAELNFPEPTARVVQHQTSSDRVPFAWTKTTGGARFVLTRKGLSEPETILLEIEESYRVAFEEALESADARQWFRFIKTLPPSAFCGYFPNASQGRAALSKTYSGTEAEHVLFDALALQLGIMASSAHAAAGLARKLVEAQPVLGPLKLRGIIADLEPADAKTIAFEPEPSSPTAGALPNQKGTDRRPDIEAEPDDDAEIEDD